MWSHLIIGLGLVFLTTACNQDKFAADRAPARNLTVEVADAEGLPGESVDVTTSKGGSEDASGVDGADSGGTSGSGMDDSSDTDSGESSGKGGDDMGKGGDDDAPGQGKGGKPESDKDLAKDKGSCAAVAAVKSDRVKVSGSENTMKISNLDAYALKVTGNLNDVGLEMKGQSPSTKMPGVCIFIAGNQNKIKIDIEVQVGIIFVKARGNQPLIEVNVAKDAAIGALQLDFAGNQPKMVVQGEGKYPCDQAAAMKGNLPEFVCGK